MGAQHLPGQVQQVDRARQPDGQVEPVRGTEHRRHPRGWPGLGRRGTRLPCRAARSSPPASPGRGCARRGTSCSARVRTMPRATIAIPAADEPGRPRRRAPPADRRTRSGNRGGPRPRPAGVADPVRAARGTHQGPASPRRCARRSAVREPGAAPLPVPCSEHRLILLTRADTTRSCRCHGNSPPRS